MNKKERKGKKTMRFFFFLSCGWRGSESDCAVPSLNWFSIPACSTITITKWHADNLFVSGNYLNKWILVDTDTHTHQCLAWWIDVRFVCVLQSTQRNHYRFFLWPKPSAFGLRSRGWCVVISFFCVQQRRNVDKKKARRTKDFGATHTHKKKPIEMIQRV